MVLDIILVAFVALLGIIGLKRGIARTIYGIICLAVAGVLAYMCGKLLAEFVYNNFILNSITESVKTSFESASVNSGKLSEGIFKSIPGVLTAMLGSFGVTQKGFTTSLDSLNNISQNATLTVVDKVITPVIISILSVGFIILLFIIFLLILKFLIGRHLLKLFNLPVVKWVNAVLGFVFGIGEGVVIVFLAITLYRILTFFSADSIIPTELINSSYLFNSIYYWDFTGVISNITGL